MKSPFPGMDPYLERHWRDVHSRFVMYACDQIQTGLPADLLARVEERVYVENEGVEQRSLHLDVRVVEHGRGEQVAVAVQGGIEVAEPYVLHIGNEPVTETSIEIREVGSGNRVITVVEFLSPTNKIQGSKGRESFMEKRRNTLESHVHWIEIDLLRAGIPSITRPPLRPSDYRILMFRAKDRRGRCWRFNLQQPLPMIGIPLRGKDPDIPLDLGKVFCESYDHGAYDLSIDYRREPMTPFSKADKTWAHQLLREHGLR